MLANICAVAALLLVGFTAQRVGAQGLPLQYSQWFCGQEGVTYATTTNDSSLAGLYPLTSFSVWGSNMVINAAVSNYADGSLKGPTHGGSATGKLTVIDLYETTDPVKYVTACCSPLPQSANGVGHLLLFTANRVALNGGTNCYAPDVWVPVPEGYTIGGLVSQSVPDRPWLHRVAYIFVSSSIRSNPTMPLPPSPPSPTARLSRGGRKPPKKHK